MLIYIALLINSEWFAGIQRHSSRYSDRRRIPNCLCTCHASTCIARTLVPLCPTKLRVRIAGKEGAEGERDRGPVGCCNLTSLAPLIPL